MGEEGGDGGASEGGVCDGVFYRGGDWHSGEFGGCEEVVLEGCWYVFLSLSSFPPIHFPFHGGKPPNPRPFPSFFEDKANREQ